MDAASAGATKLTNRIGTGEDGCNASPRWSPDGARIAFITGREADVAVYVMNADGWNTAVGASTYAA